MSMNRETILNIVLAALLIAVPVIAQIMGEPFIITLATKVAILGMAGVGLNIALGFGGLVSFGHAAFSGSGLCRRDPCQPCAELRADHDGTL